MSPLITCTVFPLNVISRVDSDLQLILTGAFPVCMFLAKSSTRDADISGYQCVFINMPRTELACVGYYLVVVKLRNHYLWLSNHSSLRHSGRCPNHTAGSEATGAGAMGSVDSLEMANTSAILHRRQDGGTPSRSLSRPTESIRADHFQPAQITSPVRSIQGHHVSTVDSTQSIGGPSDWNHWAYATSRWDQQLYGTTPTSEPPRFSIPFWGRLVKR